MIKVIFYVKHTIEFDDNTKGYKGHFDKSLDYMATGKRYYSSKGLNDEVRKYLVNKLPNNIVAKKGEIKIHFVYPQTDKQKEALRRGQQLRWLMGCTHIFERKICEYTEEEKVIRQVISNCVRNLINYYPNNTKKILEKWK